MKNLNRSIAALAALAAVALLTTNAWALGGVVSRVLKYDQVIFRSQVAANAPSVWDSVTTMRVGVIEANSVLDTTVAISTEGWVSAENQALSDTSGYFCSLLVHDASGADDCESGADSLQVAMQASPDGQTWVTLGAHAGGTAMSLTNPITSRNLGITSGAFMGRLSMNGAALGAGKPVWLFKYKIRSVTPLDGLDYGNAFQFPFIRFILSFADAKGYKVQAKVAHFVGFQP